MKNLVYLFIGAILIGSCSKSSSTSNTIPSGDYSPVTNGSYWTYNANPGGSFTFTATTKDSIINGKTYKVINNTAGANVYFGKVNTDYYRYGVINYQGFAIPEELYFKDNMSVGGTWQTSQTQNIVYNGTTLPITLTANYTVVKADTTLTLGANTFTNAVKINLDIKASYSSLSFDLGGGDFYYKAGVGLIRYLLAIKGSQIGYTDYNQEVNITSYQIK